MRSATDFIVVHCSATRPSMDVGSAEIDRWHRAKGWFKIGYHFVIRRNGAIETGRELMEPGAHAVGYNDKSIGICMVGGVTEDGVNKPEENFTPEQWGTLKSLLREMKEKFVKARIIGHNEVASKACPSFDVQAWLKANPIE